MAFLATNSSGLEPFRQVFIKWSTVDTSREFLYSVLSLDIQEKPLSLQEDETAMVKLISTCIHSFVAFLAFGSESSQPVVVEASLSLLVLCFVF